MKPETDTTDELQRMLALKRHEQPPTQFFQKLSDNVLQRLQTPEPAPEPTWRQKLGLDFDTKPVLVCATGVGVCGLLLLGLISAQHVEPPAADSASPTGASLSLAPYPAGVGPAPFAPTGNPNSQRRSVDPVIAGPGAALKPSPVPLPDEATPNGAGQSTK